MKKYQMGKKVGLLEACKMDMNWAVSQIAAYTLYLNGVHRGKGPTLFALAFRSADISGFSAKFIDATNLWIGFKDYLSHTGPLTGDVRTKSHKQKGNASANITQEDGPHHFIKHSRILEAKSRCDKI
jgi:hypothetical protein